ncbi:MAG: hypothetical protein ACYC6L_10870, partial [Anaerolineae bacterium]
MAEMDVNYPGLYYPAVVPDTLDLAERARLAINGIGGSIDPDLDCYQWFSIQYAWRQPYMSHHGADCTCDPKFTESLPMLRLMCGSDQYLDLEDAQRRAVVKRIESDQYWNKVDPRRPWRTTYNPAFDGHRREDEDVASTGGQGRALRALVTLREYTGDPAWDAPIRALVSGMRRIAIYQDDYAYYPDGGYGEPFNYPRSGWLHTDEPRSEGEGGEGSVVTYQAHQINALARWYALSGDEGALDLAGKLTRFCLKGKFWGGLPDPAGPDDTMVGHIARMLPDPVGIAGAELGHWYSHFHARCIGLRGMLEYARAAGDQRVFEFVRQAYEYAWEFGIRRMGWVNCYPNSKMNGFMESCAIGDLVAIAIRLSDAGLADYWDDVDALVRNQLAEAQLVDAAQLERIARNSPERPEQHISKVPGKETTDNVIQRSLGTFCGVSRPNCIPKPWVMQCCTGNATQGLYYAWEGALRVSGDTAAINLLLNRSSACADVDSYLPYEGKVVIHNKTLRKLALHLPAFTGWRDIRLQINGSDRRWERVGNYLLADELVPGQRVTVTFPVRENTYTYTAARGSTDEQTYSCTFRGSTLVRIEPASA